MTNLMVRAVRKLNRFLNKPPRIVDFGSFRRLSPISTKWGHDRGQPIGRYYVESFLEQHAIDIKGRVLEFGDPAYTQKFGGNRVTQSDVMNYDSSFPESTFVGDLATADDLPDSAFDCIIFTQCLQSITQPRKAMAQLHRILKPGGVVFLTVCGIDKLYTGTDVYHHYWSFSSRSIELLFSESFPDADVSIRSYGNVLSVICSLQGIACEEITRKELDFVDPVYPLIVAARAAKPQQPRY